MSNLIRSLWQRYKDNHDNDPVCHCQVYKTVGCAHVDGMLCDMRTCDIEVVIKVAPKSKVWLNELV